MAWLNQKQLKKMQFKNLGENVLISDKAVIYNTELISIGDNSRIDDGKRICLFVWGLTPF